MTPSPLNRLADAISCFSEWSGRALSWLTLAMALLTTTVVVMRYLLETSSIALQESVTYLHALVFLMGAAFTLKRGGHVRVDLIYRRLSLRHQALIDATGGLLLLLPVCAVIFWLSLDYVAASWQVKETSYEPGGLPYVYLLKSLLLAMPVTLALQGLADIISNTLFFLGHGGSHTEPHDGGL
ncbi:TRAP transporter small permease subunit [Porticoccus sp. W117]|uniref:TRAP transporter small permease subunit n=1 Tax=Porticoccus sp. W117 TaxID=3054777 RepID=UPI0025999B56|nr:TRAP transporter small permease subunit [Porticoccus sp. W117]MDM3870417.1 TRAP transporter small permease subunit [Porticoccus sp. W117]